MSPKKEKTEEFSLHFMHEEFSVGWRLLLEPGCPLEGLKKTYMTVFDLKNKIFLS